MAMVGIRTIEFRAKSIKVSASALLSPDNMSMIVIMPDCVDSEEYKAAHTSDPGGQIYSSSLDAGKNRNIVNDKTANMIIAVFI